MTIPDIVEALTKAGWKAKLGETFLIIESADGGRFELAPNTSLSKKGQTEHVNGAIAQDAKWLYVFDRAGAVHRFLRDVREYVPGVFVATIGTALINTNDKNFKQHRFNADSSKLLMDRGTPSEPSDPFNPPKPPAVL